MASSQWNCREGEPVRNAIRVDHINRSLTVNAEQFACGQHGEAAVLNHVGADPGPLVPLDRLSVELSAVKLAPCRITVTLKGDDADVPPSGDRGAGGPPDARIFIYVRVHHECQVRHELPRLL